MTWSLSGGSGNTIGEEVGSQIYILFCFISCTIISHITVNTYSFIVDWRRKLWRRYFIAWSVSGEIGNTTGEEVSSKIKFYSDFTHVTSSHTLLPFTYSSFIADQRPTTTMTTTIVYDVIGIGREWQYYGEEVGYQFVGSVGSVGWMVGSVGSGCWALCGWRVGSAGSVLTLNWPGRGESLANF